LTIKNSSEHFWSHVAEYPSHHSELPPNTETAFIDTLTKARESISQGVLFPFSEQQIDQIFERYRHLKELQAQGRNVVPALGWLMGVVMPLDPVGTRTVNSEELNSLMDQISF